MVAGGVDLLEAEGRLARLHIVRVVALAAVLIVTALLAVAALITIGAGAVVLLAESIGLGSALVWTGAAVLALCLIAAAVSWASWHSGE